jgi:hypothetical protein
MSPISVIVGGNGAARVGYEPAGSKVETQAGMAQVGMTQVGLSRPGTPRTGRIRTGGRFAKAMDRGDRASALSDCAPAALGLTAASRYMIGCLMLENRAITMIFISSKKDQCSR